MKPQTTAACEFALTAIDKALALLAEEGREAITQDNPNDLVRAYADLREQAEALRDSITRFAKMEQALSYEIIPGSFERNGVEFVSLTGYGRVGLIRRTNCSILEGKKEEGLQYLRDIGQAGMIIPTVPAQTLGKWAGDLERETGKEPPDDIFKVTRTKSVSLRRPK